MNYPDYIADEKALHFKNGIWYSDKNNRVSYPEEGNNACFQIEENSFWFKHRNNCIVTVVDLYSSGETFFDIGAGNGFVSYALQKTGKNVVMIEPGEQGCINGKGRGIEQILCGTFQDIQLKGASIGACGFFDVIEHVEKDLDLLVSLNPYLKPGGMVYITVPAYKFLWSKEDIDAGHYRRYTRKSIKCILKNAGYNIIYSTCLFSFLPLPIFLSRTLPYRLKIHSAKTNHQKQHTNSNSFFSGIIDRMLGWEINQIKKKKSIPFGSSCFIVAQKKS